MGEYDHLEVSGTQRTEALAECQSQLAAWKLTMPPVQPLVLHFGLGDFRRQGLIEFWVANEVESGYCGKFLFVFDGQSCPAHRHAKKHETFFVVKGRVRMSVDGRELVKGEGDLVTMPPGTLHSFTGVGPALLLETSTPCLLQDNFFEDRRVGDCGVI